MYACWVYKDEPHIRLVVKLAAMLPTELGHKDWKLLGPWAALSRHYGALAHACPGTRTPATCWG